MALKQGFVLCINHATQWAQMQDFRGECYPTSAWRGGSGRLVTCDAAAAVQPSETVVLGSFNCPICGASDILREVTRVGDQLLTYVLDPHACAVSLPYG